MTQIEWTRRNPSRRTCINPAIMGILSSRAESATTQKAATALNQISAISKYGKILSRRFANRLRPGSIALLCLALSAEARCRTRFGFLIVSRIPNQVSELVQAGRNKRNDIACINLDRDTLHDHADGENDTQLARFANYHSGEAT
jgi:hypothetical protein